MFLISILFTDLGEDTFVNIPLLSSNPLKKKRGRPRKDSQNPKDKHDKNDADDDEGEPKLEEIKGKTWKVLFFCPWFK